MCVLAVIWGVDKTVGQNCRREVELMMVEFVTVSRFMFGVSTALPRLPDGTLIGSGVGQCLPTAYGNSRARAAETLELQTQFSIEQSNNTAKTDNSTMSYSGRDTGVLV